MEFKKKHNLKAMESGITKNEKKQLKIFIKKARINLFKKIYSKAVFMDLIPNL